jgi:RNA 2',3'-cyclic 3'-phosphodiesterase
MPDTIRAFVAIELPHRVIASIAETQSRLKEKGFNIRWVRPENIHLTIKFLGNIASESVETVCDAVSKTVNTAESLSLEASGLGVFPNMRRPRVVWVGITGHTARLHALQEKVDIELLSVGFSKERRPFQGHLTLGRVKGPIPVKRFQEALDRCSRFHGGSFPVDALILIKSDLKPTGSEYTKLCKMRIS